MVDYDWKIGKMAKDFYTVKFGEGIFSANKVKELLTTDHNFNKLLVYNDSVGYCICRETNELLHYSYPFYILHSTFPNLGLGMMLQRHHLRSRNRQEIRLPRFSQRRKGEV